MHRHHIATITMMLALLGHSSAWSADPVFESWDALYLQGNRIGYNHAVVRQEAVDGQPRFVTESLGYMTLKRAGQNLKTTFQIYSEETPEGDLVRFQSSLKNPPDSHFEMLGLVVGDELQIKIVAAGRTVEQSYPHASRLKSISYIDRYLQEQDLPLGESAEFETFDPQLAKVVTVTLKRLAPENTNIWGDEIRRLERVLMTNSGLPNVLTTIYLDGETRRPLKSSVPLIGMESFAVTREEALREVDTYDQLVDSLIPVKTNKNLLTASEVTYHIIVDGVLSPEMFPAGPTQDVVKRNDGSLEITVRKADPRNRQTAPATVAPGAEFLASTRFLECQAPLLLELSLRGTGTLTDPLAKALALEKFVRRHITQRNLATAMATALEVAQSKSGDCTEHAVLLAALLRSAGIPSRVAMGVVYSPDDQAFIGHMWTEAWLNDHWLPLDGTRAVGGTGCSYIKLSDSPLAGDGALPGAELLPLVYLQGRIKIAVLKASP